MFCISDERARKATGSFNIANISVPCNAAPPAIFVQSFAVGQMVNKHCK